MADAEDARRGGVTTYVHLLFKYLNRQTVSPFDWNLSSRRQYVVKKRIGFLFLLRRRYRIIKSLLFLDRRTRSKRIELIHLNPSLGSNAIKRDLRFARKSHKIGIPFVVFFHGWNKEYEAYLESNTNLLQEFVKSFNTAAKILVLADEFKKKLISWGLNENNILVETIMVDDSLINEEAVCLKLAEDSKKETNILFMSRIEKAKGIYEAIDTIRYLREDNYSCSMTIAGTGSELLRVKEYTDSKGINWIKYLGWVEGDKKSRAFLDADVLLFPSYSEGMPNVVLEAMAFGLPVITRNVGGLADFFRNEEMGYFTDSYDYKVFAEFCKQLITNRKKLKQIGKFNYKYAKSNFLASQVTKRIEMLYADILEEKCR